MLLKGHFGGLFSISYRGRLELMYFLFLEFGHSKPLFTNLPVLSSSNR